MITGSADIKAWLIEHDGALPANDPQPSLVGPILNSNRRFIINYNTYWLEFYDGNVNRTAMDCALPFVVSSAVCDASGACFFAGDDISVISFLKFPELEAWLAEHNSPTSADWQTDDEVDVLENEPDES